MLPIEGNGATALTPEAALALQRAMERQFTNSQGVVAPAGPAPQAGPDFSAMAQYSGPSAAQMAAQQFGPQFQALQNIINQTNQRYDTASSDIGSVYKSLQDKIRGQAPGIQQSYDQTGQKIGGAYNAAINSVSDVTSKNQAAIAEMLQRLGIAQQAAPDALNSMGNTLSQNVGALARDQAGRVGFNAQQGQNEVDYNNRTADTAGLAGSNAQRDIALGKQNALFQTEQQRLGLLGQQTAAENQYAQMIAKMQTDSQSNAFDTWYKMQQLGLSSADNDTSRAKLELDTKKFQDDVARYQQSSSLDREKALNQSGDAYAILASRAGQMLGEGTPQAAEAVDRVMRAYQTATADKHGAATLNDILRYAAFNSQTAQEAQIMQALATTWYQQLGNKQQYGFNF